MGENKGGTTKIKGHLGVIWKPNRVESSLTYTYKKVKTWKFQNN